MVKAERDRTISKATWYPTQWTDTLRVGGVKSDGVTPKNWLPLRTHLDPHLDHCEGLYPNQLRLISSIVLSLRLFICKPPRYRTRYDAPSLQARTNHDAHLGPSQLPMERVYAVVTGSPRWTEQHMALLFVSTAGLSAAVECLLTNCKTEKFSGLATDLKNA